ncbi:MAG TPA: amidohydrolase family protein, partial [Pseudonocardiaceae bacterium]|nr:amidohydrolase family protein [Pseudonocardiaceae bacterium]
SRPARRLGLTDRGVIREGAAADLVLFDPETIADAATYEQPRRPATGVHTVLVNGVRVLADGRPTGALPGHSIRRAAPGVRG